MMSVFWFKVCRVLPECHIFRNLSVARGRCSKLICKLFQVSKFLNWSNSKTTQILYDKSTRQIILLHLLPVLQVNFKNSKVKPDELLPTGDTSVVARSPRKRKVPGLNPTVSKNFSFCKSRSTRAPNSCRQPLQMQSTMTYTEPIPCFRYRLDRKKHGCRLQ